MSINLALRLVIGVVETNRSLESKQTVNFGTTIATHTMRGSIIPANISRMLPTAYVTV